MAFNPSEWSAVSPPVVSRNQPRMWRYTNSLKEDITTVGFFLAVKNGITIGDLVQSVDTLGAQRVFSFINWDIDSNRQSVPRVAISYVDSLLAISNVASRIGSMWIDAPVTPYTPASTSVWELYTGAITGDADADMPGWKRVGTELVVDTQDAPGTEYTALVAVSASVDLIANNNSFELGVFHNGTIEQENLRVVWTIGTQANNKVGTPGSLLVLVRTLSNGDTLGLAVRGNAVNLATLSLQAGLSLK